MIPIDDIEKMSMEEVKRNYDEVGSSCTDGLNLWQMIYQNKKQDILNDELIKNNKTMLKLTKYVTYLTGINVIVAIVTIIVTLLK